MAATIKQEYKQEPSAISPGFQATCNDFNFDSFVDFGQVGVSTPTVSPLSYTSRPGSTPSPTSATLGPNTLVPPQPVPLFAPPSHQYDQYRQHAGFAPGAMQNTLAVNQGSQYGNATPSYGMIPPSDGYFGEANLTETGDIYDFNTLPSQTSSGDIDMEFGSSMDMNTLDSTYIDPAAIGGQDTTLRAQPTQVHPARVYPGHHQQQAQAKAQAEAQRQAMTKDQQKAQVVSHSRQISRNGSSARPNDPIVDASISRLLSHMRQTSVASSHDDDDDDAGTPTANGSSQRSRKEEEDMDEDERLLASEEGKKLSSKERRQLRNKVSARAFRSRRKEYIGQLEGEISVKDKENDDLRKKNEGLKEENRRLTDLTQMLLESPHFQPFLDELSRNPDLASLRMSFRSRPQSQMPAPSQGSSRPKDMNPGSKNMHIGLTIIPEEPTFDYTTNASFNTGFTNSMGFGGLYDAQVYAVTTIPEGHAVDAPDFGSLSGKASNCVGPCPSIDESAKDEQPSIEEMPVVTIKPTVLKPSEQPFEDTTINVSDAALALFSDTTSCSPAEAPALATEESIFGDIELDKAFGRIELLPIDTTSFPPAEASSAILERFERMCARCDALSARVASRTSHM